MLPLLRSTMEADDLKEYVISGWSRSDRSGAQVPPQSLPPLPPISECFDSAPSHNCMAPNPERPMLNRAVKPRILNSEAGPQTSELARPVLWPRPDEPPERPRPA